METSDKTARRLFRELQANPTRRRFGFGTKPVVVNVDLQNAIVADRAVSAFRVGVTTGIATGV